MALIVSVAARKISLVKLSSSSTEVVGGKCLDGTSAGFYIREGVDPSLFVIHLEGGGFCSTEQDCASTAKSDRGSSTSWTNEPGPQFFAKNKLLDEKCDKNPDFCNGSTAYVPYCTGDVHIGTRTKASAETWGFNFDGYHNFVAIIDMLIADYGLGDATQVLLTGVSAGGIGVFHHIDYLADRLPSAVVKGAPIAGWYLPGPHPTDDPSSMYVFSDYQNFVAGTSGNDIKNPFESNLWGSNENLPQDCIADFGENFLPCTTLHNRYRYIKSSLYIVQAQYDTQQIYSFGGAPEKLAYNDMDLAYVDFIGDATRASLEQIINNEAYAMKPHPDGIYAASCLHHSIPKSLDIDGLQWTPLVNDWFFQHNEFESDHQLVESCPNVSGELKLPCNAKDSCRIVGGGPSPSPTPAYDPMEESCRLGLESKGCTSSQSNKRMCRDCAKQNRQFLKRQGCTMKIAKKACRELGGLPLR
jgi:ribosome maturation protein SDO1